MITSKYYIENELGARIDFTPGGESDFFLINVNGLGDQRGYEVADFESGFFSNVKTKFTQGTIAATIRMGGDVFADYRKISDFIYNAKELFFVYCPYGENEYYCEVVLNYLTKTQRQPGGWAEMPISFKMLTPWYLAQSVMIQLAAQIDDAFYWPFTWDENLYWGNSNAGRYSAEFMVPGHVDGSLVITYKGKAVNPTVTLVDDDGTVIGECIINATFTVAEGFELSTDYLDSYVRKINHDGTRTDLIDENLVDITKNPFFRAPVGHTCTVKLTANEELTGKAEALVYTYYRTV